MSTSVLPGTKSVVVADDTAFVRDRFRSALEGGRHTAILVRSGPELLARVRADLEHIDLIVLDLRLPQSRGVELIRKVRRIHAERPRIVVFSGTIANADEVRQLASLGVAGYVNEYAAVQHILPALTPHLFPNHLGRRSSPRVSLGIPVSYRYGNTIANGVTLNVGRGGIAIRTTSPLDIGTPLKARFRLPSVKIEIDTESRVAWIDRRVGMGLQFTAVEAASQTTLEDFVNSHFFSNRKA
jgi:CheY-like chemotaxis protein